MVKLNKEDYKKMKYAMETKDFSVLKGLNLHPGIVEENLLNVLEGNAYSGRTLEWTFGGFELTDGPTEFL